MRKRLVTMLVALALPTALVACQEPEDPPNPEVAPGAPPVTPEPGMTTGQVPEVVDQDAELQGTPPATPDSVVGTRPLSQ